jgi:hypothetical protein
VVHAGHRLGLAPQPGLPLVIHPAEVDVEQLDGHLAIQLGIASSPHLAHATPTQQATQGEAPEPLADGRDRLERPVLRAGPHDRRRPELRDPTAARVARVQVRR